MKQIEGPRFNSARFDSDPTVTRCKSALSVAEDTVKLCGSKHGALVQDATTIVRYVLWYATGWRRDYVPLAWRNRATEEQKRIGWEMAVRIEKILCTVLYEAHKRQVEEATQTLSEGSEDFYRSRLD